MKFLFRSVSVSDVYLAKKDDKLTGSVYCTLESPDIGKIRVTIADQAEPELFLDEKIKTLPLQMSGDLTSRVYPDQNGRAQTTIYITNLSLGLDQEALKAGMAFFNGSK